MKQRLSMLWVFLLSFVVGAWADTEVSPVGGTSNATVNGTSFSINGTTNAGSGTKISPMSDKGIKVRVNTPLVMTVNAGYRINSVTAYAASNDNSKTFTIEKIEVDGTEYVPSGVTMPITCAQKNASEATAIDITGIAATKDIKFTFGGTNSQGIMEFHVDYTQTEVILQEIASVKLNGTAIGETELAKLKAEKALTIDGSSLNGIGILDVTLSSGATTVNRAFDGDNVVYTFTTNGGADKYTVTVTGVAKTYAAAQGTVVYYKEDALSNEKKTLTIDGVAFNYPSKQFGYANNTAGVTLGETTYKPIKLSTGEAVSVTFPEGKKVKKIIVYGWSAGGLGTGKLVNFTDGGEKSVDTSNDIFFANDGAGSVYPSVYEYEVDNWEALTFQGNGDQPFVVMDFVYAEEAPVTYAISASVSPDGAATIELPKTEAEEGETVTYSLIQMLAGMNGKITFGEGWGIKNVAERSLAVQTESGTDVEYTLENTQMSLSFTMPAENVVINMTLFKDYAIHTQATENGSYTINGKTITAGNDVTKLEGDEITIEATPADGYTLSAITVTGETSNTAYTVTDGKFTMPSENVTLSVTFDADLGATATFDFTANEWNNPTATSSLDAASAPIGTLEKDGIKAVFKRATGNQPYYFANSTTAQARLLKNNILKVIAPEGKAILKVVFTAPTYNLSGDGLTEKTWTGNATRVAFNATGSCYFTQMDVTYADMTSETVDPEEADETITLDFNDPTAHSEFNVTENTYLTQDIVLSDGPAEQGSRVKTTIPFIEGAADANQNYIRVSGLNVSMYLRGGKVVFEADGDKVIKNIKMTSAAFNATLNGETVTKDQITGDGWNGNSSRVEMEVTGGTNITDITFTLGDKPVEVKYAIEAVVTPAEALTFDYNPKEAAAGEEVTVTLSNPAFGEGYSIADLLTATQSLKTESGTDVEFTTSIQSMSITFTMPAEKVIASIAFAEKAKEYEDIVVVPAEGADIYEAVQTASEGKNVRNITVYLEPGKQFTVSQTIVAPAAFAIIGAAEGTDPSTIDGTATMAEIDASALTGPMVQMSEEPAVEADANNGFYPIEDAGFINVKVTGLTQQLFYANRQKYLINSFHVNFCNINVAGGNKTIIDTNSGGVIADLDMSKNTIWAEPAHTGALYSSQSGQKATEAGLAEQVFNIEKNTFYNIAYGKNVNTHRQNSQTWLTYNVRNNVFVNTGKSGQAIKGLNGGGSSANPTWNVDGNAFNFDGADTSAAESTGDDAEPVQNSLAGVFAFTDAATGDFNGIFKGKAAEAPAKYPGDPRWTYTYEIAPTDIVINPEDITDGDISAAFAAKTEGVAKIGNVSINLDGATNYTVAAPIVVPGTVEIVGNGATIDASGMTGNGIVQYVPYEAPADATPETPVVWTEANVSFSGLTVKGMPKALFYSNSKNYYASSFIIDNCVIEQASDATTIDYTKGSVALNFIVQNSTIYAPAATTKSFYSSQAGQKATEYDANATQTFTFQSNTLYNLAPAKNLFTHRQNNQKWLIYNIAENIIVNCGKSGQAVKSFNGGGVSSNPTWAVIGNVFNFDGADTSAAESTGDDTEGETVMNSYAGVVTFTDASSGDFNGKFAYTGETLTSLSAGDPRWTLTLEEATPTGINGASLNDNVEMINDNDAPAYNLAGQKVGKNYKGIVIKNGKKVVMK